MKRIIIAILLILLLCSCSDDNTEDENFFNPYIKRDPSDAGNSVGSIVADEDNIYMIVNLYGEPSVIKYNYATDSYRLICSDPLCDHTKDCLITRLDIQSRFAIQNNKLYFWVRLPVLRERRYVEYDILNNKYRILESVKNVTGSLVSKPNFLIVDNYRYYYAMLPVDDIGGNYSFTIARQNLTTLESEIIKENADSYHIALATEHALFFDAKGGYEMRDPETLEVIGHYATKSYALTYDGNHIWGKWVHENGEDTVFARIDPVTYETEEFIFPGIIQFYWLGDDYIYFTYNKTKKSLPIYIDGTDSYGEIIVPDSDVYKLDKSSLDSGNPVVTKVCSFEGEWENYYLSNNAFIEADGDLYATYVTWGEDKELYVREDGLYSNANNRDFLLRIDTATGEISIVEGTVQ